jgi:putative tricarboxylic transport membrane protein
MRAPKLALTVDRAAGALFIAFALYVLFEARRMPFGTMSEPGPGAFPALLALTLLVCSVAVVLGSGDDTRLAAIQWPELRHAAAVLGTLSFMALALERLGYRITIFTALFVLVAVIERKGWLAGAIFAGVFSLGTHFLFGTLLRVTLPGGSFWL